MKRLVRIGKILLMFLIVASFVTGGRMLLQRKKHMLEKAPRHGVRPQMVEVATAKTGSFVEKLDYVAVVEPIRIANISSRLISRVEKVLYVEGDSVRAGEPLIILDSKEIEDTIASVTSQIQEAKAEISSNKISIDYLTQSYSYWQRELKRKKQLLLKKAIAIAEYDNVAEKANEARGKLNVAKAQHHVIQNRINTLCKKKLELNTKLSYCSIKSPYDGIVSKKMVDPGDLAQPGKTLVVVEDRSQLRLSFNIPQQDLLKVKHGMDVLFFIGGKKYIRNLSRLFPSLDSNLMVKAEVCLKKNNGLYCGSYISISVIVAKIKNIILLPASCLVTAPDNNNLVYVIENNRFSARMVKKISMNGDEVAVKGVRPGEKILMNAFLGWSLVSSGQKVKIIK